MKTLLLLLIAAPAFCFAQATTELEYTYMKKGFRQIEENGNDVKKGYTVEELPSMYKSARFYVLKRSDSSYAGIIAKCILEGFTSNTNVYYAIPTVNSQDKKSFGWSLFENEIANMPAQHSRAILYWLAYRNSYVMSQLRRCDAENKMIRR